MLPYQLSQFGNPHSRTHAYGWESEAAVEKAREVWLNVCCMWWPVFSTLKCGSVVCHERHLIVALHMVAFSWRYLGPQGSKSIPRQWLFEWF